MYVDAEMLLPLMSIFTQEVYTTQHNILLSADKELLCSALSTAAANMGNLVQSSTISEYDLGVEGDLFKAPEPILESQISVQPLITTATVAVADIGSMETEDLLSEVFYNCKNDLLEKSAIIEPPGELYDGKNHSVHYVEDSGFSFPGLIPREYLLSQLLVSQKELLVTSVIPKASPRESVDKLPAFQVEENLGINKTVFVTDGALQKSASLECINSIKSANSSSTRPRFLDFHELNCGAEYGMRRAYSEGDIQTLGSSNSVPINTSIIPSSFELLSTIGNDTIEEKRKERKEKLSRYRKKRTKRNFGRKIKYACRKALADNQPRIRGRFAKTEEKLTKSEVRGQQL